MHDTGFVGAYSNSLHRGTRSNGFEGGNPLLLLRDQRGHGLRGHRKTRVFRHSLAHLEKLEPAKRENNRKAGEKGEDREKDRLFHE